MTDHQGLPVLGYRPQSDEAIEQVNALKMDEERILRRLDVLKQRDDTDQRWLAVARGHIEQGFMAAARAIFQPVRTALPEDFGE